jgi:hypothetical protein
MEMTNEEKSKEKNKENNVEKKDKTGKTDKSEKTSGIFAPKRFSELGANERRYVISAALSAAAMVIVIIAAYVTGAGAGFNLIGLASVILVLTLALIAAKMTGKKAVLLAGSILGLLMIIAGLALTTASGDNFQMMITGGFIMFIICFAGYRKPADRDIQDERSLKIGTWGMAYSWYLTYLVIILAFWLSYFKAVTFTVEMITGILIILMPVSTIIFQKYFASKGDVY